jgi:hypothetical protein
MRRRVRGDFACNTHSGGVLPAEPGWMTPFLASLARDDVAPTTLRGYPYDLRHFLAWRHTVQDCPFTRWIPPGELLIVR